MKKVLFVILFAALLLCSACGKAEEPALTHEVVSQPPDMVVTAAESSVTRISYDANWIFLEKDGRELTTTRMADKTDRWCAMNPQLMTSGETVVLTFSLPPDELSISRYSVTDGRQTFCELTESGDLILTDGCWTYVCMAQWTDESRPYHGWARYTVCIEKK